MTFNDELNKKKAEAKLLLATIIGIPLPENLPANISPSERETVELEIAAVGRFVDLIINSAVLELALIIDEMKAGTITDNLHK